MTLVELLELIAVVAVLVAVAWAAALVVPIAYAWPVALGVFGVLLLLFSQLINSKKGGEG